MGLGFVGFFFFSLKKGRINTDGISSQGDPGED